MSKWSVQDQENSVKAAVFSSAFISLISFVYFLDEISLLWFKSEAANDLLTFGYLIAVFYFFRTLSCQPGLLNYGWRLRELHGDYADEYLRSRYQRATALAFQLMIITSFLCIVLTDLLVKFGWADFLSFKLFSILTVLVGSLSFYLKLRTVFNEQDDIEQETN
ncbi:hypothetical protein [Rheinheimera sp. A13L]|uniref:hypothetical protein n=1 Tax=Rheinheimera sp. A13L TaxID=506534 RepID=UPI000301B8EE|nr:hypothetical protein [Rheinheimera sp. A13L]